ncbi:MAG: undecaprenyldiphospho-muramoylpentapeptide beta-N-acetylglucosaminyltransferase [Actinomycetota bacterium]|nr:undecaprenyldiphospho-muramoylpentapeptide beta-N-acetylglucosaminyltransferase [Actinomycetota bacterium]
MRAIIAGGGSGGHLFPGLALARELTEKDGAQVLFVGAEKGIESRIVPKSGFPIKFLPVEGVMGRTAPEKAKAVYKMAVSFFKARGLMESFRPDVVIGTGGYASFSPVMAAWSCAIPSLIMEQNVAPGAANKLLARVAGAVAVTYQESMPHFPRAKSFLTGNPIRKEILEARRADSYFETFGLEPGIFTVFVFGGSSGARAINSALVGALEHLLDLKQDIQFLHQCGETDYQGVREAYRRTGFRAMVAPFVFQMPEAYAVSDLVISRAGATTLAEMTALGKAAVLIPYPYAGGHQELNAEKLEGLGAAILIRERELTAESLAAKIRTLKEDETARNEMSSRSRVVGKPEAARNVADIALSLVRIKNASRKARNV